MDVNHIPLVSSVNEAFTLKPQVVNKYEKIGNSICFKEKKLMIFKLSLKYKLMHSCIYILMNFDYL